MEIKEDSKVYEVSYHIVPSVAEDAIPAEVEKIRSLITDLGGKIVSEGAPELKTLAYSVSKTVKAIKSNYSKAYFGWMKFTLTPESIEKIKTALDASDVVLRYLIISTVLESTLMADKEKRPARPEAAKEKQNETPMVNGGAENEAELDKSIDELVIN